MKLIIVIASYYPSQSCDAQNNSEMSNEKFLCDSQIRTKRQTNSPLKNIISFARKEQNVHIVANTIHFEEGVYKCRGCNTPLF